MPRLRRPAKPLIALLACLGLALAISACTFYKPGTFSLTQPGGIGDVRLHFLLCAEREEDKCIEDEGESEDQALLGIAVQKGAIAPATITATPVSGGPTITYARNDAVAQEISEVSQGTDNPWPPAGTEGIGYLSAPFTQPQGAWEWAVDANFGLPLAADGGAFGGPFQISLWVGARDIGEPGPADRPIECHPEGEPWTLPDDADQASCEFAQAGELGASDLKIAAPAQVAAYLGGKAAISFPFDFATTASAAPSFALSATSTLPKAKLSLASPTFVPGTPDPTTHRSPTANQAVTVTVPKNANPGTYDVTLTATTPQGTSVSQVAKLKVAQAKISLGGAKLNKTKGTATLSVKIPGAGTVTATGKGVAKVKKSAKKAKKPMTLKLTIRAKGKAKKQLAEEGTAKVGVKVTFGPLSGMAVTRTRKITLKKD